MRKGLQDRLMLVADRVMPACLAGLALKPPTLPVTGPEAVVVGGWVRKGMADCEGVVAVMPADVEAVRGGGLRLEEGWGDMAVGAEVDRLMGRMGWGDSHGDLPVGPPW